MIVARNSMRWRSAMVDRAHVSRLSLPRPAPMFPPAPSLARPPVASGQLDVISHQMPTLLHSPVETPLVHNFSPGPGQIPASVMQRAQSELLSWPEAPGMSVMSISHRETDGPYQRMQQRVAQQVRAALDVPRGYEILFMQGGAHAQFAAVPLNLLGTPQGPERQASASVDTGFWARRAAKEHAKYARVTWAAKAEQFSSVPHEQQWQLTGNESYVHICANETIEGLEYLRDPDLSHLGYRAPPIAADFTSTLLSRPVDISKYGVVYCSGGKNLGPAGLTLVIVREDLLTDHLEHPFCPAILSYRSLARSQPIPNIYATPPTFNVYMLGLVLEHLQAKGGVSQASVDAEWRAALVYNTIEASKGFYTNKVVAESRSRMSVPFRISGGRAPADALALEQTFLKQMEAAGFRHLAGHPLHGGVRASLYHGVPNDSVLALVAFMERFQKRHQ